MASAQAMQMAAIVWTRPETQAIDVDPVLAEAFAELIDIIGTIPPNVIQDIQKERSYQITRAAAGPEDWTFDFDDVNTMNDWVAYINRYTGAATVYNSDPKIRSDVFRKNMVKVATLAVAAIEAIDRGVGPGKRHYDS